MTKTLSQYLVFNIDTHYFAANVLQIDDVIRSKKTTNVPLSKKNITGLSNLRGHIVTEIDVAKTLNIQRSKKPEASYSVVTHIDHEFYSLAFDGIGDVIEIPAEGIDPLPETVQKKWHFVSHGVFQDRNYLIVLLDFPLFIKMITENKSDVMSIVA
jgi:purine-binding chemotaxis protein CheW